MLLAIDTTNDNPSLALAGGGDVFEAAWRCQHNHTVELLPHLANLLAANRVDIGSLRGVVVARGPGGFNGLRAGISTAKGLAYSLGIPVAGISSLEAVAYQQAGGGLPVCPVFDAGRGEIATAVYQDQDGRWQRLVAEHITTTAALAAEIQSRTIFCGNHVSAIAAELRRRLGDLAVIVPGELPRARFVAELGERRLAAGDSDRPATLQPLYLRRPAITKAKHR